MSTVSLNPTPLTVHALRFPGRLLMYFDGPTCLKQVFEASGSINEMSYHLKYESISVLLYLLKIAARESFEEGQARLSGIISKLNASFLAINSGFFVLWQWLAPAR